MGRRQRCRVGIPSDVRFWLNWIESEFAALRYFALNGTDHRSHAEQNAAIAAYVRWRNAPRRTEDQLRAGLTDPDVDRIPALSGPGCLTNTS